VHVDIVVAVCFLLAAAITDLRWREIPDVIPVGLLAWGVGTAALGVGLVGPWLSLVGALGGLGAGLLLFRLGGLGGGDVKLVAGLGAVLGPLGLLLALRWIGIAGGLVACLAALRGKRDLAYAPAIAAGLIVQAAIDWSGGMLHAPQA